MANTVDILGEQETLDGLVTHTLEDFEDNRVTAIRAYAFYSSNDLKSVNLPNATTIGDNVFNSCKNIENVKIPKISDSYLPNSSFHNCYKLNSLDMSDKISILQNYVFDGCFSLNSLDLSNIKSATGTRCLSNTGFGTIVLPKCVSLGSDIASGARTSTVDLSQKITLGGSCFSGANSLVHLILRSEILCTLSTSSAFTSTPIEGGLGWIYVPTDLVDSYKTATNWSAYTDQIVSIDEYPKALDGETITDSWDEIFQAEDNDTYKTKYNVGDTKYLIVGGTYVLMQIIAFDRDILSSDNTSTAKITWLAKSLSFMFPTIFANNTTSGWAECDCREFLNNTIYEQIPENVRNRILEVNKTFLSLVKHPTYTALETLTSSDKLWIPSAREILGGSGYEDSGIDYSDFFTDSSVRKKAKGLTSNFAAWRVRSSNAPNIYSCISYNGSIASENAVPSSFLSLGFCT